MASRRSNVPRFAILAIGGVAAAVLVAATATLAQAVRPVTTHKVPRAAAAAPTTTPATTPSGAPEIAAVERRLNAWETAQARTEINRVLDRSRADHLVALGKVLTQEKRYGDGEAELRRAAEVAPADPSAWLYLGESYLAQERTGEASQAFEKAHSLAQAYAQSNDKTALYLLGVAQQRTKRYDQAVATLDRARAIDGQDAMVLYQLGATHAFRERWQDAINVLGQAIERDSGIAYAYYYRGLSAGRAGRKDLLINDLTRFLKLAPQSPDAPRARKLIESASR